ncbi:hypothetical protein ABH980_007533 [Bradyrhizobium ottawaense]
MSVNGRCHYCSCLTCSDYDRSPDRSFWQMRENPLYGVRGGNSRPHYSMKRFSIFPHLHFETAIASHFPAIW